MTNIKALVITSSTRKKSNSIAAAKLFTQTLEEKEASVFVKTIDINPLEINPCTACLKCRETFECIIKDDAPKILELMAEYDSVIVASPVYFMGSPAKLKALIDRSQPAWFKYSKGDKKKEKPAAIILTAELEDKDTFAGALNEIKSFLSVNGFKAKTKLTLGNMHGENTVAHDKEAQETVKKAAADFADA